MNKLTQKIVAMKKFIAFICISALLVGCGKTPYEKGQKLAEEYDACLDEYLKDSEQVGEDFAEKIPGKYDSRVKAMEDYLSQQRECYHDHLKKWQKLDEKTNKVRRGVKSIAELEEFESGLSNRQMAVFTYEPDIETVNVPSALTQQLRTIVPDKPDEHQIMRDLVGHSLLEGKEDGYYPHSWKWDIKEGGISDLKIIETKENNNERYVVLVSMRLSSDTRAFDAKTVVGYTLGDISDWNIEYVNSKGLDIVKTHKYDDCVKCYVSRGTFSGGLFAENNCDIALEVAGRELEYSGQWRKFCRLVPPHQQVRISYSETDFRVDYIERP